MSRLIRFAWLVLVVNVGVILVGASVRATGSGAGCGRSWPTCAGELVPDLEGARALEYTHRVVSGTALVLVVILVIAVFRKMPKGHRARLGGVLALVAIVGEALIGAMIVLAEWVAEDTSVARAVSVPLHLVNTLFLLAALTLTIFWLSGGRDISLRGDRRVTAAVVAGGLALIVLAASGAITALADTLFPKAEASAELAAEAHFLTRMRVIHPLLAVLAAALAAWFSARSLTRQSRWSRALLILVGLMLVTGSLNVFLGVPVWMQLVHLAFADTLWIVYVMASANALQVPEMAGSRLSPSR